jgi:hypothetical protein
LDRANVLINTHLVLLLLLEAPEVVDVLEIALTLP